MEEFQPSLVPVGPHGLLGETDVLCVCVEPVIMETLWRMLQPGFYSHAVCKKAASAKEVAGFRSVNMLSSPSTILEFHFSYDRKDSADILQSCGFGQFQCSSSASC